MRKKGFTLIELLAVIVILAIIALIATPMILGVIDSAKRGAVQSSAYGILEAAETYYGTASLGGTPQTSFDLKTDTLLSYKGKRPERGELYIRSDGKMSIALVQDGWCAIKQFEDKSVQVSKNQNCTVKVTEYAIGDEVTFTDDQRYNVIAVGTDTVTLLKQESIGSMSFDTGRQVLENDYCKGTDNNVDGTYVCNAYKASPNFINGNLSGPVKENSSLFQYLNTEWVASLSFRNSLVGDVDLLTYEQYNSLGGRNTSWLNNGTIFWTMSIPTGESENNYMVIFIDDNGYVRNTKINGIYYGTNRGVRPVITIKKYDLEDLIVPKELGCVTFDATTGSLLENSSTRSTCAADLVIPNKINGIAVTKIGNRAFFAQGLTSVIIPDSVTTIEETAFGSNHLTNVTLSNRVTQIGEYSFSDNQLTNIVIPSSVKELGEGAFLFNQLTKATIEGKSSSTDFTVYGADIWGWGDGSSDRNIVWNP